MLLSNNQRGEVAGKPANCSLDELTGAIHALRQVSVP